MEYRGGSYGFPYENEQTAGGANPADPRSYRADPVPYGSDPSPYGRDGGGYAPAGMDAGYADPGYPTQPADPYRDTVRRGAQAYGGGEAGYEADRTGSDYDEAGNYAPRRTGGYTGRIPRSNYDGQGYDTHGYTGRTPRPGYDEQGYESFGATGRTSRTNYGEQEYEPRGATGRTVYARGERDDDERDYIERAARTPKRKKKRSKFGRFMHALGLYLAQLPAKTLVVFGSSLAVVLIAVILLVVLLPLNNSQRTDRPDDGQLALTDATPTPSLAPTNTPGPTDTPEPTLNPDPLNGVTLSLNMFDEHVPDIQKRLVELGYMKEPEGGYTEKYGPSTRTAVRLFQMKNFDNPKDDWDGLVGKNTYNLLMSDQAKAYYLSRGDGDENTRIITKLVQDVTDLQNRLIQLGYLPAGNATGQYGNSTVTAVVNFQEYHGLSPIDGIAGQTTLQLIYSAEAMDATTGKANNKTKAAKAAASPDAATTPATPADTTPNP